MDAVLLRHGAMGDGLHDARCMGEVKPRNGRVRVSWVSGLRHIAASALLQRAFRDGPNGGIVLDPWAPHHSVHRKLQKTGEGTKQPCLQSGAKLPWQRHVRPVRS